MLIINQCWGAGAGPLLREPKSLKSLKRLPGAWEPKARPIYRELKLVKEIYKNGSQELGAGSWEPVKKGTGSLTRLLILCIFNQKVIHLFLKIFI